jgi:hypothetical protein
MENLVALVIAVCLPLLWVPVLQRLERHAPVGTGTRGEPAERHTRDTNIVVLDPDLAEVFPDSESVNRALRVLCEQRSRDPAA